MNYKVGDILLNTSRLMYSGQVIQITNIIRNTQCEDEIQFIVLKEADNGLKDNGGWMYSWMIDSLHKKIPDNELTRELFKI